jgi:hypothetical protein
LFENYEDRGNQFKQAVQNCSITNNSLNNSIKMKQLMQVKGDKGYGHSGSYWLVFVYACFSASSNLAYLGHGTGNTLGFSKTFCTYLYRCYYLCGSQRAPYHYFRAISKVLPVVWILLTHNVNGKGLMLCKCQQMDQVLLWVYRFKHQHWHL